MPEILTYAFMQRAFLAGLLVGLLAPALGTFLVLRRLSLVADSLSHVALMGVALGFLLKTLPSLVALVTTTAAAVAIERLRATGRLSGDIALALFLYSSLGVAVILIGLAGGFNVDLFTYLFGSITTVGRGDLLLMGVLAVVVLGVVLYYYAELVQTTFDPDLARVSGVPVDRVNIILALLTGATVTMSMRVVGVLLVGALTVIPVLASLQLASGFRATLLLSMAFGVLSVLVGLVVAFYWDLPAGGAVVMVSLAILMAAAAAARGALRLRRRTTAADHALSEQTTDA
ncbi:MAG: metal ABC transporter permease [Dehalococcoidia bacterium]|nr:metal ABC transporter permease [Dehalococcoidia bacterium]